MTVTHAPDLHAHEANRETFTRLHEAGLPLVGVVPSMLRDGPGFLLEASRRHRGEVFSIKLGPEAVYVVSSPAHLQHVLVDHARDFGKGGMWKAARTLLGNGLVTSEGDFWLRQRRLMQPLFGAKHLASLGGLMVDAIERERERIGHEDHSQRPVEMGAEMTQITQRVLLEAMFSTSFPADEAARLCGHLDTAFQAMNLRLVLYFLPDFVPLPGDRANRAAIAAIDEAVLGIVRARRERPLRRTDILSQLLDARDADTGEAMSDRQVRDELVTLFVAGLDTTAVTLTWMFYLLDRHPHLDARLRAEVSAVLGGRNPTVDDLPKLAYTKRVLQETMRLYPPGWLIPRNAVCDTVVGGRTIPAGASMILSPYLTHRDPAHWEDPDTFDPERFLPERAAGRPKLAYVPFGAGGRQCIGNHFAMMEAQLITAMLVQRFKPRLASGRTVKPTGAGTLKPAGGLWMNFDRA